MHVIKYLSCYVLPVGTFATILKITNGEIFFSPTSCAKPSCRLLGVVPKHKYLGKNVILTEPCEHMLRVSDDAGNWSYLVLELPSR